MNAEQMGFSPLLWIALIVAALFALVRTWLHGSEREHARLIQYVLETEGVLRTLAEEAANDDEDELYVLGLRRAADEVYALGCLLARDKEIRLDA